MAGRIRTHKPELYRHELLQDLEEKNPELRPMLVFLGLMTQADRKGRFRWNPRVLALDILPFVKFELAASMELLMRNGLLRRYEADGVPYGCFPSWAKHQIINNRERESEIPAPLETHDIDAPVTRETRVDDALRTPLNSAQGEGNKDWNKEGNGRRYSSPSAPGPDEPDSPSRVRPEDFGDAWNQNRGSLPKVTEFTKSRRSKAASRIAEGMALERFTEAVRRCASTPFLRGENERGWKADFDWLIRNDGNVIRVLEGGFDGGAGNSNRAQQRTNGNRAALEAVVRDLGLDLDPADRAGRGSPGGDQPRDFKSLREPSRQLSA